VITINPSFASIFEEHRDNPTWEAFKEVITVPSGPPEFNRQDYFKGTVQYGAAVIRNPESTHLERASVATMVERMFPGWGTERGFVRFKKEYDQAITDYAESLGVGDFPASWVKESVLQP
jgi:hypothetical protein